MTRTALELCTELGYPDAGDHQSGSPAKALLDNLQAFVNNEPTTDGPYAMAYLYLQSPAKISRKPYPRSPDGYRLTELLSQLFSLIMQSRAMQGQVIDLEETALTVDDDATLLASPANADGPPTLNSEQIALQSRNLGGMMKESDTVLVGEDDAPVVTVASQGPESNYQFTAKLRSPQPKLALREPRLVANLLKAGFIEPFPVTASSEAELVQTLEDWMIEHPGSDPPGTRPADPRRLSENYVYATKITLVTTSEEVLTRVCLIATSLVIYLLQDTDGSCMLAEPEITNSTARRGHYGWLGGDLGFTARTIANSDQTNNYGSHSSSDLSTVLDSVEGTLRASITKAKIKKEPTLTEVRQATLRRNQTERQADEHRWRFETPPLSSMDTVKKRRWPPQYVSPPPTPQPKRFSKRRSVGGMLSNRVPSRSSSPVLLSVNPLTALQTRRRSARINGAVNCTISSPPKTPKKTKSTAKKTPNVTSPEATSLQPPILAPPVRNDVILHFFLSNDSLGAVPVTLAECNTATNFFNQALSAWNLVGSGDLVRTMAAVSVTIDGFHWPIVLPWNNATAFERLIETIAIAKIGKMGNLEVKVKCIKR